MIGIRLFIFAILSLVITSTVNADTYKDEVSIRPFNGFYVGAGLGDVLNYENIDYTTDSVFILGDSVGNGLTIDNSLSTRNWKNSGTGIIDLGWGHQFEKPFYLGAELFINAAARAASTHSNSEEPTLNIARNPVFLTTLSTEIETRLRTIEYGIDIIPGYLLDPTSLIYFRIGAAFNKATVDAKSLLILGPPAITSESPSNTEAHKNVTGLRLGIGLEKYLGAKASLSLDYVYTNYGSIDATERVNVNNTLLDTSARITVNNGLTNHVKSTFASSQVYLGFKYRI